MVRIVRPRHGRYTSPMLPSASPIPRRGARFWAGLVAFFVVAFGLKVVYFYVGDLERGMYGTLGDRLLDEATGAFYMLLAAVVLAQLLRRIPLEPAAWRYWLPRYLAVFAVASVAHTLLMVSTRQLLAPALLGHPYGVGPWSERLLYEGAENILSFTAITSLISLTDAWRARRDRELHAAELARSLTAAQLRNLQLQLQPHFLFNALNTVSERMYDNPASADEMLARLAHLLRRSLATMETPEVPLREELEMLQDYAALMRERFGPALEIAVEAPDALGDALVPPFLLQPLVENAVRHGRVMRDGQGRVEVRAGESGGALVLRVEDDGPAPGTDTPRGLGVGLRTARERLALLYGDAAALDAAPLPEGGYRVALRLPLRRSARPQAAASGVSRVEELAHARAHR